MTQGKRGKRGGLPTVLAVASASVMLLACPVGVAAKPGTGAKPAGAKPAGAKPARSIFGTTAYESPSLEEFQRMAQGGLRSLRLTIYSGSVEPRPGSRMWPLYDRLVGDAARAGITVDPLLFGSPSWLTPTPATLPIHSPAQVRMWSAFVRDIAVRYGPSGHFWAQHPEIPARPMRHWEIWNEPNIYGFSGWASVRQFARLLRITRKALRSAGRGHRIVLGGLYRRPKPGGGITMTRYLERLYALRGGRSLFDAVAIHPYAARPRQILRVTESARRVMDANRDGRTPIWITEVGWTTGGNYWAQSLYRVTLQTHAMRVRRTARLLLANRSRLRLERVDWHTWRDLAGFGDFWSNYMGFFTPDGTPKPAWGAFTALAGGVAGGKIRDVRYEPLPPAPRPPPGGGGSAQRPPSTPPPPSSPPPPSKPPECTLIIFCS